MSDFEMKYKGSELQALVEGSAFSLFYAGTIGAAYSIPGTNGAQVTVSQAFRTKYNIGENKEVFYIVDKRMIAGDDSNAVYIYPADYEGCYFVMGDFEGNDAILDLGATKGDWLVVQGSEWVKIATQQREIAGISGNVTAEALAQKLSTPTPTNADPLVKQSSLEGFVRKDEAVDFATDLTGVVEATPEMFTFRPSAGDKSVRDESAVIRRIKGNTSVWGQKLKSPSDEGATWQAYTPSMLTTEIQGREIRCTLTGASVATNPYQVGITGLLPNGSVGGHKYLFCGWVKVSYLSSSLSYNKFSFEHDNNAWTLEPAISEVDKWTFVSRIWESSQNNDRLSSIRPPWAYTGTNGAKAGDWYAVKDAMLFDITDLFDAGYGPTTYDVFRKYYPDAYYPYCPPELRAMRATGIETIGFNAFNGEYAEVIGGQTYYLGGAIDTAHFATEIGGELEEITIPENRLYTPSTNGYIYATGSDICINLSHSGVRNGEYKPYEKNTLLLPEIAKYFPNGMHGIGDECDEIIDGLAIQRCAVRAYEEGDESNVEVKTDKITTVYKLSEPIYTPIDEPLQLDYKVDDFGTEKMLSDAPSSPFKADIVYQFNAEGRIRDNSRNIEKLEEQLQSAKEDIQNAGVQSDWLEDNPESKAFIKNKPTMPTQVATAPEVITMTSVPSSILPNVVYMSSVGFERFTLPTLVDGDANAHNVWKVIFISPAASNLTFPDNIAWKDGITPNWAEAGGYCELTFTKYYNSWILGEWKLYK